MPTDIISNAQVFLDDMKNFGVNAYFLEELTKRGVKLKVGTIHIDHGLVNHFINANKNVLSKVDCRKYFIDGNYNETIDLQEYLKQLKITELSYNSNISLGEIVRLCQFCRNNYDAIATSNANALHIYTKLASGYEDLQQLKNTEFKSTMINQIGDYPLYATAGMKNSNGNFLKAMVDVNFKYVVALGVPGVDFTDYFSEKSAKSYTYNSQGKQGSVTVSDSANVKVIRDYESDQTGYAYSTHQLELTDSSSKAKHNVEVLNVKVPDGKHIYFNESALADLHVKLTNAINNNENVLVHCKAGFGRTGQFVATLMLLQDQRFEKIFADQNHDNILKRMNEFITDLRVCRPGLILEPAQLFFAFENAYKYKVACMNQNSLSATGSETSSARLSSQLSQEDANIIRKLKTLETVSESQGSNPANENNNKMKMTLLSAVRDENYATKEKMPEVKINSTGGVLVHGYMSHTESDSTPPLTSTVTQSQQPAKTSGGYFGNMFGYFGTGGSGSKEGTKSAPAVLPETKTNQKK